MKIPPLKDTVVHKIGLDPDVIHVPWNIFAFIPALNPLLTTPHILLTLTVLSFPPLLEEIVYENNVGEMKNSATTTVHGDTLECCRSYPG